MRLLPGASIFLAAVAIAILVPLQVVYASAPAATQHPSKGPTAESAMAAEEELARAMRENDSEGIARMLTDDWVVINANGGVAEGKDVFPSGIRAGILTRNLYDISEPRVRVNGSTAAVTVKLHLAGTFNGKPFDVMERVTDVFVWKNNGWKAFVTHETFLRG